MEFGAAAAVARWTRQGKWVGYTMVTSVWFDREQVENGDFLPQVNGEELSPDLVVTYAYPSPPPTPKEPAA